MPDTVWDADNTHPGQAVRIAAYSGKDNAYTGILGEAANPREAVVWYAYHDVKADRWFAQSTLEPWSAITDAGRHIAIDPQARAVIDRRAVREHVGSLNADLAEIVRDLRKWHDQRDAVAHREALLGEANAGDWDEVEDDAVDILNRISRAFGPMAWGDPTKSLCAGETSKDWCDQCVANHTAHLPHILTAT